MAHEIKVYTYLQNTTLFRNVEGSRMSMNIIIGMKTYTSPGNSLCNTTSPCFHTSTMFPIHHTRTTIDDYFMDIVFFNV